MKFLKLNPEQHVELIPRCNCGIHAAIDDAIDFVIEQNLKGADLIFEEYCIGIYPEDFKDRRADFTHEIAEEFKNWKKNSLK